MQLDPVRLAAAGLAGQDVYTAIRGANVLQPTGGFQGAERAETIGVNGQLSQAEEYAPLVLKAGNGAILRLSDVATVVNGGGEHPARRLGRAAAGDPAEHLEAGRRERDRDGGLR